MHATTTVAIVDDDARIRDAALTLVRATTRFSVAGEAATVEEALALLRRAPAPDVLLVDLGLPDGSGVDLLRAATALSPRPLAIVLTVFQDDSHIFDALRAGAIGYVLKHDLVARLVPSLEEAAAGGAPMSPTIARRVLGSFAPATAPSDGADLTPREREVTELLAHGSTYDEIGRMLGISTNTVRHFIRAIYEKLQVCSKAEAVREAIRLGLVPRP